jgi:hypothetical protein
MAFENPEILRGCDALVSITKNNVTVQVGWATEITLNENNNQKPIRAIGYWKPRGASGMFWDGSADMTVNILTKGQGQIIEFDFADEIVAATPYEFTFKQKSSGVIVATAVGFCNTRDWSIMIEDTSAQRVNFTLVDLVYKEGFRG